jgi:hypothetical protein
MQLSRLIMQNKRLEHRWRAASILVAAFCTLMFASATHGDCGVVLTGRWMCRMHTTVCSNDCTHPCTTASDCEGGASCSAETRHGDPVFARRPVVLRPRRPERSLLCPHSVSGIPRGNIWAISTSPPTSMGKGCTNAEHTLLRASRARSTVASDLRTRLSPPRRPRHACYH